MTWNKVKTRKNGSALLALALMSALVACGGGGGSSGSGGATQTGEVDVALTDAPSDDLLNFIVDVQAVDLTTAIGSSVRVLDQAQRIDFAQLTDVSELITSARVPVGLYTGARLTLDLSNAQAMLVGQTSPAAIQDSSGNPLTGSVTVDVRFDTLNRLNATLAARRLLLLDFDLDSSMITDTVANTIRLEPVLVASIDPSNPKPFILRGRLASVDSNSNSVLVNFLRPFAALSTGQASVSVNASTVYQVNGQPGQGSAGLSALANLATNSPIRVRGTINLAARSLLASSIEAGTGADSLSAEDVLTGFITARSAVSGTSLDLTISGGVLELANRNVTLNRNLTLRVDTSLTQIVRREDFSILSADDLAVGQRVTAFGVFNSGSSVFNASASSNLVRILRDRIFGTLNSAPNGSMLSLNVSRIGPFQANAFSFTNGINPASLAIDAAQATLPGGLMSGTPIELRGQFSTITSANPNYQADVVIDRSRTKSIISVRYALPRAAAFSSTSPLTFETSGLGLPANSPPASFAFLDRGFVGRTVLSSSPAPSLPGSAGLFVLALPNQVRVFSSYSDFTAEITAGLQSGLGVQAVVAFGDYDTSLNALTCQGITISLR